MASLAPADGSEDGSMQKGKKRGFRGDREEQGAAQKPKRRSWNPFASTEENSDSEEDPGPVTPSPPRETAEERAEHQIRMARDVDEAARVVETERILDVIAREGYNPDIKPTDVEWIEKREEVVALLQDNKKSVLRLLGELGIENRNFKALQLLPSKYDDLALELQKENTELYKKAIGPGGRFEQINDNLATKLTMLQFELPIKPMTLKNVENCEKDINDPPDDEMEPARVQRIIYSEKALQFLDCYHERSFGFPMLRRPKVMAPNIQQPVDETSQPPGKNPVKHGPKHHHHIRQPVQPTGDLLCIRGGGGTSSSRELHAYPSGASQPFEDNAGSFTRAIKKLFPAEAARAMSVSLYSRQLNKTTKATGAPLDHTILFPLTTNLRQYLDIHKRVFQGSGWTVVVHQTTTVPAGFWPPSSGGPSSAQIRNPSFLLPKPSHTVWISKATLEKQYLEDIEPRFARGEADWAAVVRLSHDDAAPSFTPFEVLPNLPIPTPPAPIPPHLTHGYRPPPSGFKPTRRTLSTPPTSPVISTGPSFIYGYSGQIEAEKNVTSFTESALALLGLSNVDAWSFTVDLHDTDPPKSIEVSAAKIADRFERFIKNVPGHPNTYPWPVFVRKCARVSTKRLAPPEDLRHYVILRGSGRESYWKLPTPLGERYGMNQLQDAFFSAMLVHYPLGSLRLPQNVDFNTDLGYGGMEITQDFWDTITRYFSHYPDQAFTVCGNIPPPSTDISKGVGIRLAGTHRYGIIEQGDYSGLAETVRQLSRAVIFDNAQNQSPSPTTFRAWFTAENRENNVDSHIFYYDDNDPHSPSSMTLEDSLKAWFQSESIAKSTNCIWFRPEWKLFTVIDNTTSDLGDMDVDHTSETWDATADSSLDSFRDMLDTLFNDGDEDYPENFEITIPGANQRFVINRQTTQDSWRKHIFDYFHGNTLIVKRSDGIPCMIDSSEPWGILDMPSTTKPAARVLHRSLPDPPKSPTPSQGHSYGDYLHHVIHMDNSRANENSNSDGDNRGRGDGPPPVVQPPHESRRIPGAKPPIFKTTEVPKFDQWMLNHTAQDTLQQRSWTQDQSVIEPGYAPAAPLYGDNLELTITAGSSMPTVYIQHLTPTDIMQLRKENRKLLNHALEREIGCPICNVTFKAYDNDSKTAHFKSHIDQLNSVGTCPMCNETWALFTFEQKRNHLLADFSKKESQDIVQFWEDIRCPICNLDLRSKSADDVTTHIASHIPGALKFCDRCGFDVLKCTPVEKDHHDRERHEHFKRCRVPGGAAGTNCKRCGKKLAGLSGLRLASHNNECYRKEPASLGANDNPEYGLSEAVESQRLKNAIDLADLRARQSELRTQENAMLARKQALLEREADDLLANYHHHGEKGNGYSDALNASLAEFKRRLPDFREAHAILQNLVDASGNTGMQHHTSKPGHSKTPAEMEWEEKEHKSIYQMENQLGIKRAKEEYNLKHATDAIRNQRSALFQLRAELADEEDANPVVEGSFIPVYVIAARTKVDEAEATLSKAENDEEQRSANVALQIGQQEAALVVRKKACDYVPDPAHVKYDNGRTPGGNQGGGAPEGAGSGGWGGGGGGNPIDGDDATQAGSKRKKAAMDESEDTMPGGGFANLVRSPSKRETKKMRMAGERMGSPKMMRRRGVIAEEAEGEGKSGFDGGVPRRATRGTSGAPGAASRKVVLEEVEDDRFEDVEEED
ncbi:hypothetical protein IFR05_002781 [Cadophora sp. M221]|nr:hypothetical protein IFR05_002781 [Cadophora sp. M221]